MAAILVVDDRPHNRELLRTLLVYRQHRVIEARDGAEALSLIRQRRPDLVISDILMPVMDGYELVRNLRTDPDLAALPVIFWTAHYLEREARVLAEKSGAVGILVKPSDPEEILRIVDAALASVQAATLPADNFNHEHLRLLTNKLSRKTDEEYWAKIRLQALVEAIYKMSLERDVVRLLEFACREAREMIGSASSIVGIPAHDDAGRQHWCIRGAESRVDHEFCNRLRQSDLGREMTARNGPFRFPGPEKIESFDRGPDAEYSVESFLSVPIATPTQRYGWLFFINKVGMETFTSEDEQLAQAFAAEVALAYEGLRLYKEVERLNAELTRSNADLRQCTRIACHHLQEPLRSVQGFAQLLTRRYGGRLDPEADEFLSFIQDGVRRMRSLVVDFEEYARLSRPEEARREIVSLDQACRAAIEACSQAVKESGAVVTVEALPVVRGVRSQLCQVFDHLIANAIKFRSAATPAIRIHAEDRAQFHVIGVQDNGTGIEPRHLDRIFEIFERLQGNAVAGTGIGLALCKKIIELHGGRLWVESAVGCGSDFYFTLPMLPSPLADGAPRL